MPAHAKDDRPVTLPILAKYLVDLRKLKGWPQTLAANIAERRKLAISYNTLRWIEEGKNQSPEPELLRDLATLYDTSYEDLVARFLAERYGLAVAPDELSQTGTVSASTSAGGIDAAVAAVVEERDRFKAALAQVSGLAEELLAIAVIAEEDRQVSRRAPGRAKGSRKNR